MIEPVPTGPVQTRPAARPGLPAWLVRRRARRLRRYARTYAAHGWPVARLAVPAAGRCPCPRGGCTEPHLLDDTVVTTAAGADRAWGDDGWGIAVVTAGFDLLDLPARYGARLHHLLSAACPTATARRGARWHFVLAAGSTDREAITAAGGVLHTGPDGWAPVSPTRTEATGAIGWIVPPAETSWQPYRHVDPVAAVLQGWRS